MYVIVYFIFNYFGIYVYTMEQLTDDLTVFLTH